MAEWSTPHTFVNEVDDGLGHRIPIAGADPYLLWGIVNEGRGLQVIPSTGGAEEPPAGLETCTPDRFAKPANYLQVLIEVTTGLADHADEDARRIESLEDHLDVSRGGLRLRGVFTRNEKSGRKRLVKPCRFVTGLVADWWLFCFLERIPSGCVRWEIGHARSAVKIGEHTSVPEPAGGGWSKDDKLLDGNVMVIIDYGCPFAHPQFRSPKGSRVRYVWFQGQDAVSAGAPLSPVRYFGSKRSLFPYGRELRGSDIDQLIASHTGVEGCDESACYESIGYELMREASTHGGHVMSIACGSPNPLAKEIGEEWLFGSGAGHFATSSVPGDDEAAEAEIIFIELPRAAVGDSSGGSMNVHLVDALHYVLARTKPSARITVNCSMGTHAGPHDGSSMLEQAIDDVSNRRYPAQFSMVVPVGNAFNSACHAFREVSPDVRMDVSVDIPADKSTPTLIELWYPRSLNALPVAVSDLGVELVAPDGSHLRAPAGHQVTTWSLSQQPGGGCCRGGTGWLCNRYFAPCTLGHRADRRASGGAIVVDRSLRLLAVIGGFNPCSRCAS